MNGVEIITIRILIMHAFTYFENAGRLLYRTIYCLAELRKVAKGNSDVQLTSLIHFFRKTTHGTASEKREHHLSAYCLLDHQALWSMAR